MFGILYGEQKFSIPSHMNYGKLILDQLAERVHGIALDLKSGTAPVTTFTSLPLPQPKFTDDNLPKPSYSNYGAYFLDSLSNAVEKPALIDGLSGEQLTFRQMAQQVVNLASALLRSGIKPGEVVGICSENRMEFLVTALATWCAGATVTFHNSAYNKNEMVHTMKISKPKYMFVSPQTYKQYYQNMIELNIVEKFFIFDKSDNPNLTSYHDFMKAHVDVKTFRTPTDVNGLTQTALILYSSGTTGLPKGVKITHLNLITSGNQTPVVSRGLVCLSVAPFSNTVGIILTVDELIHHRTVVYLAKYKEDVFLDCVQKYRVGLLLVVPPLIVGFAKSTIIKNYDVSSVEYMYSGGAPLDLGLMKQVRTIFPNLKHILQGYGMTESTGAITEETDIYHKQGSVGKIALGNIVKIVDIDSRKVLGPNQEGEICIKGPVLFSGYIGKDFKEDLDDEGFYKTGDIGYYDEEGFFYIVDRLKELIKYKAGQVAPSELEALLIQHPAVKDVGVVGIPDSVVGELPTAFVVKRPGAQVTDTDLINYVAPKVSSWKQLRGGVHFVPEIPKTASGKILRRVLRDSFKKPMSKL